MIRSMTIAAAALLAAPVLADGHAPTGDAEAGEEQFGRQCVACHVVRDDDGEVLAGRNARTGPNLHGLAGRQIASLEDFRYSDALIELGEEDRVWTEEAFVAYVQDPTGWLREELDNNRARGKMAYRVRSEEDALDLYAFLATFDPVEMEDGDDMDDMDDGDEAESETETD
nr:c-type cytochrome [Thalassorhabdomicrobium marinisediminis]